MNVGFIGLGNIGKPIAERLADSEHNLWVYDVNAKAAVSLADQGAQVAASVAELGAAVDVVGLCVRNDQDVWDVCRGGLFGNLKAGATILLHSTVLHQTVLEVAAAAQEQGLKVMDAPMTGGAEGAQLGTLCYMVGGSEADLNAVTPVLEPSAEKIVHAGELGTGMTLKLCNNLMTYSAFVAIHEAGKLAQAGGLSMEVLQQVGQANGVITAQMQRFIENRNALYEGCSVDDFKAIFSGFAALGKKDLEAALASAQQLDVNVPGTALNAELIESVFFNEV